MAERKNVTGVHLWLVLWRAANALETRALAHIGTLNMCISDFAVLELLLHKGVTPVNTIARKVLLTSGSITPAVDRLVKRGFAERKNDPGDRRVRLVRLTANGRRLIVKAFKEHEKVMERAATSLNQTERAALIRLLKKLGRSEAPK
ncbi:MAG: MarR family winged helix-turn-helix transcriptional regulator [Nitrospinota bacterium]